MKKNESEYTKFIPCQELNYNKRELYSKSIHLKRNISSPNADLFMRKIDLEEFRMEQFNTKIKNMLRTKIVSKKNTENFQILQNKKNNYNTEKLEKTLTNFFNSTQKSSQFSNKIPNSYNLLENGEKSNFNSANSSFSACLKKNKTTKSVENARISLLNKNDDIDDFIDNLQDHKIKKTLRSSISKQRKTIELVKENFPEIQIEVKEEKVQNKLNNNENEDLKSLFQQYSIGHIYCKKEKQNFRKQIKESTDKSERKDLYEKFMIDNTVTKPEKQHLLSILSNRGKENVGQKEYPMIQVSSEKVYQDVFKSYKKLKVNRQLLDNIGSIITKEQIEKYENIYLQVRIY
jgi:hypothetical protein